MPLGFFTAATATLLLICPDDSAYILSQVEAREQARKDRDFSRADLIRDELLDEYDVVVDDKLRQWAVGGTFSAGAAAGPQDVFVRRGGGNLSKEEEDTILALIGSRNHAKRDKDFLKADRIWDRLQNEFSVRVDDKRKEWVVVTKEYTMSPVTSVEEGIKAFIEEKISDRAKAKLTKNHDLADAISEELYNVYNIYIDDSVREWRVDGAEPTRTTARRN